MKSPLLEALNTLYLHLATYSLNFLVTSIMGTTIDFHYLNLVYFRKLIIISLSRSKPTFTKIWGHLLLCPEYQLNMPLKPGSEMRQF